MGQNHIPEIQLASEIHNKLKSDSSISYSEIANKAFDAGRKKLALSVRQHKLKTNYLLKLYE